MIRLSFCFVFLLSACGDDATGSGEDAGRDGGTATDAGDSGPRDACVPRTCEDIATGCGMHPDGCGGVLDCGTACGCATADDCPSRPCEVASCEAETCSYEPVTCG